MTKREVRDWFKRVREDLRAAETALRLGDTERFLEAVRDGGGSFGELESALDNFGEGIRGLRGGRTS